MRVVGVLFFLVLWFRLQVVLLLQVSEREDWEREEGRGGEGRGEEGKGEEGRGGEGKGEEGRGGEGKGMHKGKLKEMSMEVRGWGVN